MNDVLLIKKLDMSKYKDDDVFPVTFNVGLIEKREDYFQFFDALKEKHMIYSDNFTIKNNSLTIDIHPQNISDILEEMIERNITVYGVYILYDNYLGGNNND